MFKKKTSESAAKKPAGKVPKASEAPSKEEEEMKRKALDSAGAGDGPVQHSGERQEMERNSNYNPLQSKRTRLEDSLEVAKRKVEEADKMGIPQAKREARLDLFKAELNLDEATFEDEIDVARKDVDEAREEADKAEKKYHKAKSKDDKEFWRGEMLAFRERVKKLTDDVDTLKGNLTIWRGKKGQKLIDQEAKLLQEFPQTIELDSSAPSSRARILREPADVIREILEDPKLTFLSSLDVLAMLKDYKYVHGGIPLKRDLRTGAPSILLDALDILVAEFGVPLGTLENDMNPYGKVLLAPSGAGKTRKILQYLARDPNLGYFVPYKTSYDEKLGSRALSSVLTAVNISATELSRRRERIEFGVGCVLAAFQAVKAAWLERISNHDTDRRSAAWVLMQLYPEQVLGFDVFESIAVALFKHCEGAVFRASACACFIDEAQAISFLGESIVPSVERPRSMRSALSAVLSGVSICMGVEGIVAGTGFSLAKEFKTLRSQMGVDKSPSWAYLDFPPLGPEQVRSTLLLRLGLEGSDPVLGMTASWLAGRPRWVSTFIEQLVSGQQLLLIEKLREYVKRQSAAVAVFETSRSPQTPAQAFAKLRSLVPSTAMPIVNRNHTTQAIPSPLTPDRAVNDAWSDALHQAFLLAFGCTPQEVENMVLADLDIGYIQSVFGGGNAMVKIELEPLVLESAWRHIQATQPDYTVDLVVQVGDSESAMGDQFEYVVADRVLPHLVPSGQAFETSVFLTHERHGDWRRFLDSKEGDDRTPADMDLVAAAFEGTWVREESSFGRVALQEPRLKEGENKLHQEVYKWLQRFAPWRQPRGPTAVVEPTPSMFFPEFAAGPDILMLVHRPGDESRVMLVSVQVKLIKGTLVDGSLNGTDTKDALFTVDPSKFYMEKRTATGGNPVGDETARAIFLEGLANVPVIRVLVSGAASVSRAETGFVPNDRANAKYKYDLQVVVDREDLMMDEVLGRGTVNRILGLKGLSRGVGM